MLEKCMGNKYTIRKVRSERTAELCPSQDFTTDVPLLLACSSISRLSPSVHLSPPWT